MARQYTDLEKTAVRRVRRQLREKTFGEGPLGLGLVREVPGLLANLIEFLNAPDPKPILVDVEGGGQIKVIDDHDSAIREELRLMISELQGGTYSPGSFDDKITLSYRIHRSSHRRADGLGGYEVHTEVDGDTRAEMLYAVYQSMISGDLGRVVLCHQCDHAALRRRGSLFCSDACRRAAQRAHPDEKRTKARARQKRWADANLGTRRSARKIPH